MSSKKNVGRLMFHAACFLILFFLLTFSLYACAGESETKLSEDEQRLVEELDAQLTKLKTPDTKTISEFYSTEDSDSSLSEDAADVFSLFYEQLSYEVDQVSISEDRTSASVMLTISTIDAKQLARDYISQDIVNGLKNLASPGSVEYSTDDYYRALASLLEEHSYPQTESNCRISLVKEDETWILQEDDQLAEVLTGGFSSYIADQDLLTPEEIVALHFDTMKAFDSEQMNRFLSLDTLFDSEDEYRQSIAKALANQILNMLDYEIIASSVDGRQALVNLKITTCDCNQIISNYKKEVEAYTSTSQALADGTDERRAKTDQILLDCITANTSSVTNEITLTLENNGVNWKVIMDDAFVSALLGDFSLSEADTANASSSLAYLF